MKRDERMEGQKNSLDKRVKRVKDGRTEEYCGLTCEKG